MGQVIIYPTDDGGIAVVHPTGELPVEEVARKDVPQATPYLVVPKDDMPADRTFRAAWEADFSEPDGEGDPEGWWEETAEVDAFITATIGALQAEEGRS